MGTRHLIQVKIDGQVKVAQYGQWDGYPEGQGKGIAEFLHGELDREKFKVGLRACHFVTPEELAELGKQLDGTQWKLTHPWLSRDAGSDILGLVQKHGGLALKDDSDELGGVWIHVDYLIDMDTETVSVNGGDPVPFAEWTVEAMATISTKRVRKVVAT